MMYAAKSIHTPPKKCLYDSLEKSLKKITALLGGEKKQQKMLEIARLMQYSGSLGAKVNNLVIQSKLMNIQYSIYIYISTDWFKGKNTGKSHISQEHLWFPVDFPLCQPIDIYTYI